LLRLSLQCLRKPEWKVDEGSDYHAPYQVLTEWHYQGDEETLRAVAKVSLSEIFLDRCNDIGQEERTIEYTVPYSELSVSEWSDATVIARCKDRKECVSEVWHSTTKTEPGSASCRATAHDWPSFSVNSSSIQFDFCDHETAGRAKRALDYLIGLAAGSGDL
jgi:hypothetical protein